MIETKIRAHVGQFKLDAELQGGGVICLAGKNGSGKTTFLKALGGFLKVDEGYVKVGGRDITHLPVEKRGVVMITPSSFLPHLRVDSHILWGAKLKGRKPSNEEVSKVKSELGINFEGPARDLSLGMHERVALATALLASPRAILVDEVFSNLHERENFVRSFGKLARERGIDVIFTSQDEADGMLSEHLCVIKNGLTGALVPP